MMLHRRGVGEERRGLGLVRMIGMDIGILLSRPGMILPCIVDLGMVFVWVDLHLDVLFSRRVIMTIIGFMLLGINLTAWDRGVTRDIIMTGTTSCNLGVS